MNFCKILQSKILFNILSFMETPSCSDKTHSIMFSFLLKTRKRVAYLGAVAIELPCSSGAVAVQLPGICEAVTLQSLESRWAVKN